MTYQANQSEEPQDCPCCGNAYLAIRIDIYKDEREFVYCDSCGCLADRRIWNRVAALPPQAKAEPANPAPVEYHEIEAVVAQVVAQYPKHPTNEIAHYVADRVQRIAVQRTAIVAKAEPAGVSDEAQAGDNWPWPVGALALGEVVRCLRETGRFVDEEGELTNALDDLLQRFDAESAAPSTGVREEAADAEGSANAQG